ncbi:DUF2108 domain-containing protein [Methanothermobacter wolfeii]|uniref:DUF2108 domain-containing protein n=1 Tax=Methanothermobacter wolfeii TaxID=145261 RepID=A0A9E7RWC5_METWO|nr:MULTISPECIES: DUF2108 domain-containing protein [Methanothermobacter]MDI6701642.1 DUF2108 domain-containing protein [Methanothermobacter wolfeii]MDI6842448.1 DUF2108 domain-containing protein [Methanothermobacter wolfeii]NLM02162.1 DUF2108 domain-containing protein [Methanothermobacter wolfeii]QHN06262.1 DUF2108 domain-containing protein [Methanothermobacter sp. THM-1]UXH32458.1 DUF2108 domain-containing protein [Methanothermobacter wolfeii]
MNPLDLINLTNTGVFIIFVGTAGIILLSKPLDKIIMFSLLQGGFVLVLAAARYLDVAMAAALFDPISTIILLMAVMRINDIRAGRREEIA